MNNKLVDYYAVLGVPLTASANEIRDAYRRLALEHHPDRTNNSRDEHTRSQSTIRFQYINDAYSILSDPQRRRDYDGQRAQSTDRLFNPMVQAHPQAPPQPQSRPDDVFGDVFEDLLGPELNGTTPSSAAGQSSVWQSVGAISGAALGFIAANVPGAVAGYAMGSWMGKVRDRHGKSVMEVYNGLDQTRRAAVLAAIAKRLFDIGIGVKLG